MQLMYPYFPASLPRAGAFRFRQGMLRCPEGQTDAEAVDGFDVESFAPTDLGTPSFIFPLTDHSARIEVFLDPDDAPLPEGWRELPVRGVLTAAVSTDPDCTAERLFRAYHLAQWRSDSAFCGRCGMVIDDAPDELARLCPSCGRREYPRLSPAIIVLVTRPSGEALLAHNIKFREGLYSLIAGFVEAGETLEDAVRREVEEEAGVRVKGIRYRCSQPWPFPNSIMLAFTAQWAEGEPHADKVEISDARWFAPDALPELPPPGSVSRRLIDLWRSGGCRPEED